MEKILKNSYRELIIENSINEKFFNANPQQTMKELMDLRAMLKDANDMKQLAVGIQALYAESPKKLGEITRMVSGLNTAILKMQQ